MDSVLTRFQNMSLNNDFKNKVVAYLSRVKAGKLYFMLKRNLICLPNEKGNAFILLKFVKNGDGRIAFLCSL